MSHEQIRCFFCAPTESRFKAHDPCSKHVGRELPPGWLGCDLHRYLCPDESCTCWPKDAQVDPTKSVLMDFVRFLGAQATTLVNGYPTSPLPGGHVTIHRLTAAEIEALVDKFMKSRAS
jgi:hypothetical protein